MKNLDQLKYELRQFAVDRDWDQFHSPKNLAMALNVEAAELLEHFQWLTEKQSSQLSETKLTDVAKELADIQIYLVRLADKLNIDLMQSVTEKYAENCKKYPADLVRGQSKKYNEYD
ncbi:MAG: nucleotide pyrophosphohydrolase [Oceanospirillales bacterium LUC14_002_19_P2]|nr:MAG: nucleotide pyrophosphohydrolase [Oceanospirillales bacterium LUC14_002_19_P2]